RARPGRPRPLRRRRSREQAVKGLLPLRAAAPSASRPCRRGCRFPSFGEPPVRVEESDADVLAALLAFSPHAVDLRVERAAEGGSVLVESLMETRRLPIR